MSADWEAVRIAPEILEQLEREGSEPVHIIGVERHGDGTLTMWLRNPDLHVENERLRRVNEQLRAERQAVIDCVNLYGDTVLHDALDAVGALGRNASMSEERP